MPKSAEQMAKAYQDAMGSAQASQNYKNGINNFQGNPMALAANDQAMQLYLTNVQLSVTSGRRAAALNAASPAVWKQNALNVGATRLSSGAQKAAGKVMAHFQKWAPIYAQASQAAQALPKGGKANALQRVSAVLDILMNAAGKG